SEITIAFMADAVSNEVLVQREIMTGCDAGEIRAGLLRRQRLDRKAALDQEVIRKVVADGAACNQIFKHSQWHARRHRRYRGRRNKARQVVDVTACVSIGEGD